MSANNVASLNAVRSLASRPRIGTEPRTFHLDGQVIIAYTRPRLWLDRMAFDDLPEDGIILVQVFETNGLQSAYAFTKNDIRKIFPHVLASRSWSDPRVWHYHFPQVPSYVKPYRVPIDSTQTDVSPAGTIAAPIVYPENWTGN